VPEQSIGPTNLRQENSGACILIRAPKAQIIKRPVQEADPRSRGTKSLSYASSAKSLGTATSIESPAASNAVSHSPWRLRFP
jgi:hypothetical protein